MRQNAKASRRPAAAWLLFCFSLLLLAASTTSALAATVTDRPLLFKFNGSDTTAGAFKDEQSVEVNQATGDVYVVDNDRGVIDKFNASGVAQNFTATGKSSLVVPHNSNLTGDVAIDNSGANPGRIYLLAREESVMAFDPEGNLLPWQLQRGVQVSSPCGVAVDAAGHLWVGDLGAGKVREFASTGSPPAEISSFVPQADPCKLDLDASGSVYMQRSIGGGRYRIDKYVGGTFASILDPSESDAVAVNQSATLPSPSLAGHIFTVHGGSSESFDEYDSSGNHVGSFGRGAIANAFGIAYNSSLDRVYVADASGHTVYAFGPAITGTVPDAVTEPPAEVGISKVRFNGKVNPQSVPNSYFFEWKQGTASTSWGGEAKSSAPQPLAEDSADHPVSFDASELKGNTTYQVRLVTLNTANGLRQASSPETFTTAKAAAPPAVSIGEATSVTTTSVELNASVDPQLDFGTTYRFQISTDSKCKSGFSDQPVENLESETSEEVHKVITGLVPAQHYCTRILAANSFGSTAAEGTTTSETKEFTTKAIPADEVSLAFVAPRLGSSARLNARINPEGAPFTYGFEYSEDGGATWIPLPQQENTSKARERILVAEEAPGLTAATTYRYRLGTVENEAGPSALLGEAGDFTTRSATEVGSPSPCPNEDVRVAQHTATYLGSCRGIELVNDPEKGNQHALTEVLLHTSPLSVDGERAVWNVLAGAPGGNTGAGAAFLAERSGPTESAPNGWQSRALIPPAEQQIKNGEAGGYALHATTPELSSFVFNAGFQATSEGNALVRLDQDQHQTLLKEYSKELKGRADLSDDGAHVLFVDNGGTHQLEEIGSGKAETVSLMPDGLPSKCGLDGTAAGRSFVGGGSTGEAASKQWRSGYHMIATTDASRVYFQAEPNKADGTCSASGLYGIYERNRDAGKIVKGKPVGETTLVDPGAFGHSPQFIRATPDGRAAFYLTYSSCRKFNYPSLTCETPESADTNSDPDVYRWNEETGESSCLTCVVADANVTFRQVETSLGGVLVSDDSSHVYFESTNQLVPGEGRAGDTNIYSLIGGAIHFVADPKDINGSLGPEEAQLSADGDVLVMRMPAGPYLTADEVAAGAERLEELYLYDDRDASLECISCRHGGLTDSGIGFLGGKNKENYFKISADGSTVAFATAAALVGADVNRDVDIYAWRNGVTSLITDGVTGFQKGPIASPQVHAVGADGRDILFSLVDPGLTGFERDGFANLYDARIGGGFMPPSSKPPCEGESCQGPLQPPPVAPQSASSDFVGRGNVGEEASRPRCSKGKRRRHSRCVSPHRKRKHHERAHRNHGGQK